MPRYGPHQVERVIASSAIDEAIPIPVNVGMEIASVLSQ
jgi:hypothetical protein